ncbi:ATP-dependent DNA helicase Rep [Andreprevotia lacus DSM 23236]|jgi:ATP-dependent DNA helicase Rep|uniref:ATP-dependent DNA helicase Rep n=1 Tax=Andreprevotia lacus DSM 23236 TaxID=1121001 RepID=A0A1W1WYJ5_9NEIS|nr:UvrD-helicase domain-containing protein [Andreprevotia lacus]SMC16191.1 ATP-dependent DNA helicase Rep [Andreprevotia lacus DSM 23236]
MLHLLNPAQRAAVQYLDGPCLVLAGAGSGKTRVITQKIAYLIEKASMDARNIAAITFTNKAAREMSERVGHLMSADRLRGLTVSTFHSLGMRIMREEARHVGYKTQFSILDSADAAKIISDSLGTTDKQLIRSTVSRISMMKNDRISPDKAILQADSEGELHLARIYRVYQDTLQAYQAVDFDDLIRLPVDLFEQNEEVLKKWQHRLRYLLIDEYQDTNLTQYQMVKLLTDITGQFTAVGDDDQSIYAWRGADMENLRKLQSDFPKLQVIKLEQNYRSVARILKCANAVISNNPKLFEKTLWSDLGVGDPIQVIECKSDEHEAELVAMKLLAHKFETGADYKDYAILYRGNHQARIIETALRTHKIPYLISGGQSFFDRAEIKDILSYLRLIANENDDPAFIRAVTTPKRGVGNVTLERLGAYAADRQISLYQAVYEEGFIWQVQGTQYEPLKTFCDFIGRMQFRAPREPAGELLKELLDAIDYETWLYDSDEPKPAESKWKNVLELVQWVTRQGEEKQRSLIEVSQTIALITMLEGRDEEEVDAIKMSTLHASKGLEYPHVFLIGCEEDILPHANSIETGMVEEERRLMYVGITRAQRTLTITYCGKRKRAGEWQITEPSRFLKELPADDIRVSGRLNGGKAEQAISKSEGRAMLAGLLAKLG